MQELFCFLHFQIYKFLILVIKNGNLETVKLVIQICNVSETYNVLISLIEYIQSYLSIAQDAKRRPNPPPLTGIPILEKLYVLVFELSLDTGGGVSPCKLMGKFIIEKGNQTISDIILLF